MKLNRIFDAVLKVFIWVSAVILTLTVLSVAIEVFLRTIVNKPQAWVLEFTEYGLLFITFLVAPFLVRTERNITVDMVIELLNQKTKSRLSVVQHAIICAVAFVFVYFGSTVTLDLYQRGIYNPTIMQVPMAYVLFIIPVGGVFIMISAIIKLLESVRKLREMKEI